MVRDNISRSVDALALTPLDRTATGTGVILDLKDRPARTFTCFAGAVTTADGSNYFTFKLYVGDDSGLSDGAYADADEVIVQLIGARPAIGAAWPKVNNTNLADKIIGRIGYRGTKRYARLDVVETGTAQALLGGVAHFDTVDGQLPATL